MASVAASVAISAAKVVVGLVAGGVRSSIKQKEQRKKDKAKARRAAEEQAKKDEMRRKNTNNRVYSILKPTHNTLEITNSITAQRLIIGTAFVNGVLNFRRNSQILAFQLGQWMIAGHECAGITEVHLRENIIHADDWGDNGIVTTKPFYFEPGTAVSNSTLPSDTDSTAGFDPDLRYYVVISPNRGEVPYVNRPIPEFFTDPLIDRFFPGNNNYSQWGHCKCTIAFYRGRSPTQDTIDDVDIDSAKISERLNQESIDVWGGSTIPEPLFKVDGLLCDDLRKPNYDPTNPLTREHSRNGIICLANAMCSDLMGMTTNGRRLMIERDFDQQALRDMADYCDELVRTFQGDLIPRYTLDDVYQTAEDPIDAVNAWAETVGNCRIFIRNNQYVFDIDRPKLVSMHITDKNGFQDIVDEFDFYKNKNVGDTFSAIRPQYQENTLNGQPTEAPVLSHPDLESNNIHTVNFRGATNDTQAQLNSIVMLKRQTLDNAVEMTLQPKFLPLEVGDVIYLEREDGLGNGQYQIENKIDDEYSDIVTVSLSQFDNDFFVLDNVLNLKDNAREGITLIATHRDCK